MSAADQAACMHLATGLAYLLGLGALSANDVLTTWKKERRILWFGVGMFAIALAIGPHHLHQSYHIHQSDHVLPTDWISIAAALPFALLWLWLRMERTMGTGPGDRVIPVHRVWPLVIRLFWAFEAGVVIGISMFFTIRSGWTNSNWRATPEIIEGVAYLGVGWYLWEGQIHRWRRAQPGSWAGVSLSMLFPTCALSNIAFGLAVLRDAYPTDNHFEIIDWYGVVVSWFFFVLVYSNRVRREVEFA